MKLQSARVQAARNWMYCYQGQGFCQAAGNANAPHGKAGRRSVFSRERGLTGMKNDLHKGQD